MNRTNSALCADTVASFLSQHPDFFAQHADVFADLRVPHPYAPRAISLGERQVMTLRAKIKELEGQLSGLVRTARGNENISHTLSQWCAQMLAETDATQLPRHIMHSLATLFELPAVALRLWDLPQLPAGDYSADVSADIRDFAARLTQPVCARACAQPVLAWLPEATASLAIIPLKDRVDADAPAAPACFGLLVLASADAERFTPEMGTEFLRTLGELAAAALSRLR